MCWWRRASSTTPRFTRFVMTATACRMRPSAIPRMGGEPRDPRVSARNAAPRGSQHSPRWRRLLPSPAPGLDGAGHRADAARLHPCGGDALLPPLGVRPRTAPPAAGRLGRFRTYVGISHSRHRLAALLGKYQFARAIDVARRLDSQRHTLPSFSPITRLGCTNTPRAKLI